MEKKATIKIKRFDGNKSYIESFEIPITDRTTIVEGLSYIKDNLSPSLSFRVQCRSAICGTCAVKVGDKHLLACKEKIATYLNENGEILIEPVSNLPVIKDLIVDQKIYLDKLKDAKAWFVPKENFEPVFPKDLEEYDKETDCILCGICYSVCPPISSNTGFSSPINFVKIYRFWKDKNDALGDERIVIADKNNITQCIHCKYCVFQCPKGIPIEQDITKMEFYGKQKGIIKQSTDNSNNFGFGFNTGFGFNNF